MNRKTHSGGFSILPYVSWVSHYFMAALLVGIVAILCTPLANTRNYHVVSFILLFVVSLISTFMGMGPVLFAATLSALVWNFFFIPPHFTFNIGRTEDILIFGLFFIIALTNGILTTRVRRQEKLARDREKRTNAVFQLTKKLSESNGIGEILKVATEEIKGNFSVTPNFVLQNGRNVLSNHIYFQAEKELSPVEYCAAEWSFNHGQKAGAYTTDSFALDHSIFPLIGTRINSGVVTARLIEPFSPEQISLWDTFLTQISNALEREFLAEMAQKVRLLDESGRLYKTLFNSISHELRIPVATIMGAADTLVNTGDKGNIQVALGEEIFTASVRLNRLIENLLNMSRLESGHVSLRLDWYDINDLVNRVTDALKDELKPFTFKVFIQDEMPLVKIDFGLMEQVLYNLLHNSTQYAPGASDIELRIGYDGENLVMEVSDQGPGFPESELSNVFTKFFRVNEKRTGGLGLGLSIVKGFVEAHRGAIKVQNRKSGGARFTIVIPSSKPVIANFPEEA